MRTLSIIYILVFISFSANSQEFEVGQAWTYNTRAQEPNSYIQIMQIDEGPSEDRIISIFVSNLKMKITNSPEEFIDTLPHIPVSEKILRNNVIDLTNSATEPAISRNGYQTWKKEFELGKAGWWTIEIKEIVANVEKMINNQLMSMGEDAPKIRN